MGAKKHIPIVTYAGILGEPHVRIKPDSFLLSIFESPESRKTDLERQEEADRKNLDALVGKLDVLARYYGTTTDGIVNWQKLALALAFAHVPCFTSLEERPRRRGRPGKNLFDFELYQAILNLLDAGESSVMNACRTLSKRLGRWKGTNPRSLESRFHESKRKAAGMNWRQYADDSPFAAIFKQPPKPSDKYPPIPGLGFGGSIAPEANALYDHKKSV